MNGDTLAARLPNATARVQAALAGAIDRSRGFDRPTVTTADLLGGVVGEGGNLALQAGGRRFSVPAANVLEAAVAEASGFGHNYVGCEHLLLGLVVETDGAAGKILRSLGADPRLTRRAVSAALAGYVHLSAQLQPAAGPDMAASLSAAVRREMQPLVDRIERLEAHLGPAA